MPYLTGNTIPSGKRCKVIRIPDDLAFLDALNGALLELTFAYNFETVPGTVSPQDMADAFALAFDDYTIEECMEIPIGTVSMFATSVIPPKWLLCSGGAVSRATYSALFAIIGTQYGAGNGTTTFTLPNFFGRSPMQAEGTYLTGTGAVAGAFTHNLATTEIPSHNHTLTDPGHIHSVTDPGHAHNEQITNAAFKGGAAGANSTFAGATSNNANRATTDSNTTGISIPSHSTGVTIAAAGGGLAHNNLHPVLAMNFMIYAGV
jgi:microcystin-dependent protein